MKKELIKLAEYLDGAGLVKEADYVNSLIKKSLYGWPKGKWVGHSGQAAIVRYFYCNPLDVDYIPMNKFLDLKDEDIDYKKPLWPKKRPASDPTMRWRAKQCNPINWRSHIDDGYFNVEEAKYFSMVKDYPEQYNTQERTLISKAKELSKNNGAYKLDIYLDKRINYLKNLVKLHQLDSRYGPKEDFPHEEEWRRWGEIAQKRLNIVEKYRDCIKKDYPLQDFVCRVEEH